MSDLKPIGSEKLSGKAKLNRIMEIARYKETVPQPVNENSKSEYSITLADGNNYQIVKERQGYIIKKVVSESTLDYIEPMKNRKYFSSYSQAFKRLNLLAGELNRINENEDGLSLYGEQKKFVLKTPKPAPAEPMAAEPPVEPPAVPSPELPPSPVSTDQGPEEQSPEMDTEMGMDAEMMGPEGETDIEMDTEVDSEMGAPTDMEEKVTFRTIQKLTGKLTQKIRTLDNEEGMTSEDIKYVINMVLSSLNLGSLSEEDKEDIMAKFEEAEGRSEDDMGMEPSPEEDITSDTEVEDIQADMDVPVEPEMQEGHGAIIDNIFKESKIDKVLSKYYEFSKKEIMESQKKQQERKQLKETTTRKKMIEVVKLSETIEQEIASQKFLEENSNFSLIGKTNKKNLVFENKGKQIKISPSGVIL